ncbi:MAG: type II toxin-antitoxin system VapC family toxin [Candidatus Methanoperedens sp.]|nr:type II toxin-antitoxin system VapC family toxin [Candidatus Methanoperedens sp.]
MKLYLDTTILAALTYFKDTDVKRYSECNRLINKCNKKESTLVVSFYSIHELFLLPFEYTDEKTARKTGLKLLKEILDIDRIELTELLSREKKILYQDRFYMSDRTDIPHAISAYVENCDCIVTYDSHFDQISNKIKIFRPEDVPI